jgi:heparanase 1
MPDGSLGGPWDYTNAESFIRYTVDKGYDMHGWELGMTINIIFIQTYCHKK